MRKISVIMASGLCLAIISTAMALVSPRGTENTLEVATWNLKEFPYAGQATIDTAAILIRDLQLDIIGLNEITDTLAFDSLLARLPGWNGTYAPSYAGAYMKEAIIYRTDQIQLSNIETLFWNMTYEFPRPLLKAYVQAHLQSGNFDFYLIVLHLKAGNEDADISRRIAAMNRLKDYLDQYVPIASDHDWVIIGDYNDNADDPLASNIFRNFLDDTTHYRLLTLPLVGNPYWASYPPLNSLIDHIIVTTDCLWEYGVSGQTITIRVGDEYPRYSSIISDHRPVMSRFSQMQSDVTEHVNTPSNFHVGVYPNPFNEQANVSVGISSPGRINLELYDCLGRKQLSLFRGYLENGRYLFRLDGGRLNSGVYFLKISSLRQADIIKLVLIK
jgi:endonuclease/exonuclease/phosphatase family metal-dependent hydrolase